MYTPFVYCFPELLWMLLLLGILGPSQIHFAPENSAWSQRASMLDIGRLRHSSYGCDPKTL